MSWNYRVLRSDDVDGTPTYGIHEVYYENGKPSNATLRAVGVVSDGRRELLLVLAAMAEAISKPVLDFHTYEEVEPVIILGDQLQKVIDSARKALE